MDILKKNKELTESYIIKLEQHNSKFNIEKKKIRAEICTKSSENVRAADESIDFPIEFYEEITKLKIKYDELIAKEKEGEGIIMNEYYTNCILKKGK